jgi:hypothetical protein
VFKGFFYIFILISFIIIRLVEWQFDILINIKYSKKTKGSGVVLVLFGQRIRRLTTTRNQLLWWRWKHHTEIFLLGCRMTMMEWRCNFNDLFFTPPTFLSPPFENQAFKVIFLFIEISTSIFLILIYNFCFWFFCKISICFQSHH